jgi:hypothetical protein
MNLEVNKVNQPMIHPKIKRILNLAVQVEIAIEIVIILKELMK